MTAGKFNDLRHLCFRHLIGEDAADTHTVTVDMQHHLDRVLAALGEEFFQNMDDELHRRVVVVEQQHFIQAGLFGARTRLGDDPGAGAVPPVLLVVAVARVLHACRLKP